MTDSIERLDQLVFREVGGLVRWTGGCYDFFHELSSF